MTRRRWSICPSIERFPGGHRTDSEFHRTPCRPFATVGPVPKPVNVPRGSVYDRSSTESFARATSADRGEDFAFVRIIKDMGGGGFLAEVFELVGNLGTDLHVIVAAPRLFPPIERVIGEPAHPRLWRGGTETSGPEY